MSRVPVLRAGDYATPADLRAAIAWSMIMHGEAYVQRTEPAAPLRVVMHGG